MSERGYIPALNQGWLTPLYDPVLRYLMREAVFKNRLLDQANPQPGERILDLGCGTGTLTLMAWRRQPAASLVGLDGDEAVLEIARQKAQRAGASAIQWERGLAGRLPYLDASFDLVLSSMMLHHLELPDKQRAFSEVLRVLRPGGRYHIVDFGPPHDLPMRLAAAVMKRLERTREHFEGQIPILLAGAGFGQVAESGRLRCIFGPLSLYRAVRPA